jgi:hypothetical protein
MSPYTHQKEQQTVAPGQKEERRKEDREYLN